MKKNYIVPTVDITICYLESAFLAGSDPTKKPNYVIGPDGKPSTGGGSGGSVTEVTDTDEPNVGAKGFDAWSTWDE